MQGSFYKYNSVQGWQSTWGAENTFLHFLRPMRFKSQGDLLCPGMQ